MNTCTICGDYCPYILDAEDTVCQGCYDLNLAGNQLVQPSNVTWDRGRGDTGAYIVYDASQSPPLLLQAARLECRESIALGQWMDENLQPPPFIPYEPRHMIQAIASVEEARARFIEQMGRGNPASLPPTSS